MLSDPTVTSRRMALLGLLALGGCGFVPAYGTNGAAAALLGQVAVTAPDTVSGFQIRQHIVDRLGTVKRPRYALAISMGQDRVAAAINSEGDTTRLNLTGAADWTLVDIATGVQVGAGTAKTFTSYSATGSTVATQAAASAAQRRLSIALADLIVSDLILALQ